MVATRFKKTQGPVQHAEKGAGRQGKGETWPKLKQVSTDSKRKARAVRSLCDTTKTL